MSIESVNDRTDHNRLAEQFAARLVEPAAAVATKVETARKPRPPRAEAPQTPAAPVVETVPAEPTPIERVKVDGKLEVFDFEQNTTEWHLARLGIPTASCFDLILTPSKARSGEAMPDGSYPIKTADDVKSALVGYGDGKKKARLKKHIIARARAIDVLDLLPEDWEVPENSGTVAEQKTRQTYLYKLAGERLTGLPMDMVETWDMKRGHIVEPEARDLYAFETGTDPISVGFIRRGKVGCSPDSLIGQDGGLEIKTKLPHLLLDLIVRDEFPEEHKAQVQGALWLTDREWWDLEVVAIVEVNGTPTLAPNMPRFIKRAWRDEAYIKNLASEVERFNSDLDAIVAQMQRRIEQDATGIEFAAKAA